MPHRVILRRHVPDDLHAIVNYLREHSLVVAERFIDAVFESFDGLAAMPGKGSPKQFRSSRLSGVRSWAVPGFRNYLIFYQTSNDAITVLAVIHGARNIRRLLRNRAN